MFELGIVDLFKKSALWREMPAYAAELSAESLSEQNWKY